MAEPTPDQQDEQDRLCDLLTKVHHHRKKLPRDCTVSEAHEWSQNHE